MKRCLMIAVIALTVSFVSFDVREASAAPCAKCHVAAGHRARLERRRHHPIARAATAPVRAAAALLRAVLGRGCK